MLNKRLEKLEKIVGKKTSAENLRALQIKIFGKEFREMSEDELRATVQLLQEKSIKR